MKPSIVKLENPIMHYAWGSRTAIARLQGRAEPTAEPEAELWMGDHPKAPSRVALAPGTTSVPLAEWLARDGDAVLGAGGGAGVGRERREKLPFLAKILAVARPLSLQVHPDAREARAGFAREERAQTSAEHRCYPDPNAKHEMLVALSRFDALCGLRPDDELSSLVAEVGSDALGSLLRTCQTNEPSRATSTAGLLLRELLALEGAACRRLCRELGTRAAPGAETRDALSWVARLSTEHPDDPLVAAPLLMNLVSLEPGEALVVSPGTLHTYLEGTGFEVMTPSDNVVRAGLSPKHVDRNEFFRIASLRAEPIRPVRPAASASSGETLYSTGAAHFEVRRIALGGGHPFRTERPGGRVMLAVCVEGEVELHCDGPSISLRCGEAALVPAALERHTLATSSRAHVFVVSARLG